MADIATTLQTALLRAVDNVVDVIALDGVAALKRVLDQNGFAENESLRDYEVYAHVSGREITFEILVPAEAFDTEDAQTREAVEQARQQAEEAIHTPGVRTYGFQPTSRPGRLTGRRDARRDARQTVHDARRDARKPPKTLVSRKKTAQARLVEHQIALHAPRSVQVNREGKLSLRMSRMVEDTPEGGVRMPKGQFQGVIGQFMEKLGTVIAEQFSSELQKLLARRLR
jgi:hypothetical protein